MRLPNADLAFVDRRRLTAYLLSPEHPQGREKARFFAAAGYSRGTAARLHDALLRIARDCDVRETVEDGYGIRYIIDGGIPAESRDLVMIRTVWMIDRGHDRPRLITAYPLRDVP